VGAEYVPGCYNDGPDAMSRLHEGGQLMRLASILGIPWEARGVWAVRCLRWHMSLPSYVSIFSQVLRTLY
jgi:hypothetical protein